jgi:collagenase-like PrtC family protease
MRLSVAANYDFDLVPQLADWPVEEVYGKLPHDGISGGRPAFMASPVGWRRLREYVDCLARRGIAFNYLLNGACMGNREWGRSWQKNLLRLLARLADLGVTRLTVSTPYLLERIKARFPQFKVKVGIYAQIDTPRRARFWEALGADALTLESFSINRDLARLEAIRRAVRCDLQLLVNHPCLPNCALQSYHQTGIAHASDGSRRLFADYCFLRCTRLRMQDPSLFIKSAWIRPEDLGAYQAIGYDCFKLLERGIPSEELLKRVRAYSEGRFEGNLAELILPYGFRKAPPKRRFWRLRNFFRPLQMNPLRARPFLALMKRQGMLYPIERLPVRIDSAAIPADFIEGFRARDCTQLDCADCRYCEAIAERAVEVDPEFRADSLARFDEIDRLLVHGRLWDA